MGEQGREDHLVLRRLVEGVEGRPVGEAEDDYEADRASAIQQIGLVVGDEHLPPNPFRSSGMCLPYSAWYPTGSSIVRFTNTKVASRPPLIQSGA